MEATDLAESRLLSLFFNFFILVIISSYTANLVYFMVMRMNESSACSPTEECVRKGLKFCIANGTATDSWFVSHMGRHLSPGQVVLVSNDSIFSDLSKGICEIGHDSFLHYEIARRNKEINPECLLEPVSDTADVVIHGWWMIRENCDHCNHVLSRAIAYGLLQL